MSRRARLIQLLWNSDERRPRTPIRLALATSILIVAVGVAAVTVSLLHSMALPRSLIWIASILAQAVPGSVVLLVAIGIDRRTIGDLGAAIDDKWFQDFLFGATLGAVLITGILLVGVAGEWIAIQGVQLGQLFSGLVTLKFVQMAAFLTVTAISEELVARGYLLTNIAEGLSGYTSRPVAVGIAVIVSSQLFAVVHLLNPNATTMGMVGISAVGVLLAVGYVFTRNLALPIGLHLTWNLFQGSVYGFPVSGLDLGPSLITTRDTGPDVITGGTFGPEAGLLTLAVVLFGVIVIVRYVRWRSGEAAISADLTRPELNWRSR